MTLADFLTSDVVRFFAAVILVIFLIALTYYWKLDLASDVSISAIRALKNHYPKKFPFWGLYYI
jgi:hypothetical protein